MKFVSTRVTISSVALIGMIGLAFGALAEDPPRHKIVQHGKMHEAIGKKQHQGRVRFDELLGRKHFYAVAALEGLAGEATVADGRLTATSVDSDGTPRPLKVESSAKATMLVGAYVPEWTNHKVNRDVDSKDIDRYLEEAAEMAGLDVGQPFMFLVDGDFSDVSLHVINGACPIHARMKKIELPREIRPYEAELSTCRGKVVGLFAKGAVGDLTHPATSIHAHLLYRDPKSGQLLTGHLEQIGLQKGAILRLPASSKD